ncbi:hypothetical protein L1987_13474 [Smallanthus sonchifolius]|uniref:Uncharacterized protein n=1 Tax=Smallanthus sonchifolius TaxID=185202 RepID=A0ACB9JIZ7_9ASTR|nr:hypothetical protein L1987_13474 [Smallanthus sonchifolius]
MTDDQRRTWEVGVRAQHQNLLLEMNDPSLFYNEQFPQIPDFPCMSSASSSSSNPAPAKPISSTTTISSVSYGVWAVLKAEEEGDREDRLEVDRNKSSEEVPAADGSGTIDCIENIGYMDLIDGNEIWDPSSIFEQNPQQESEVVQDREMKLDGGGGRLDELGVMFFEWLKSNKEALSAEDMRNIKLKKSTVECASKRLGSSKEGKKQLLKLILDEVGNGFSPPYPPYMAGNGMAMVAPPVHPPSTFSYIGGDYNSGLNCQLNPCKNNNNNSGEYQVHESAPSWNQSQITMEASPYNNRFPDVGNNYAPQIMPLASCYPDQYPYNPAVYGAGGGDDQR